MVRSLLLLALVGCGGDGGGGDGDGDDAGFALPDVCGPLPESGGTVVDVAPGDDLAALVADAVAGTTLRLADGTYDLTGGGLEIAAEGVVVRSASGDAGAVVLEGGWATAELVSVRAADAVVAEVTLAHAYGAAVAAYGVPGLRVWGVDVVEPQGEALAVRPWQGAYADDGVVACSTVTRTETCAPGFDGTQAEGWRVWGNAVDAAACDAPGIRFWTGSKDTVVERNVVRADGWGIALGDTEYDEGDPRAYADAPCAEAEAGHYGGVVRNNLVAGGVRLVEACGARAFHNTATTGLAWTSSTDLVLANNLADLLGGDGATAEGNRAPADGDFVSADDLHLAAGSGAVDAGVPLAPGDADDDVDGEPRADGSPDVGADER